MPIFWRRVPGAADVNSKKEIQAMKHFFRTAHIALILCGLAACGGGGSSTTATNTVSFSTPASFASTITKTLTPIATMSVASTVTNRARYMVSGSDTASTSSNYLSIGDAYSASTGYSVTSGTLSSTATYSDYLTKTIQLVEYPSGSGYYRIDSHLHPNNSIDVDSTDSSKLKFRNNFGKAGTTYGFVTFAYDMFTHVFRAQNRYTYSYDSSTYVASYTLASTYPPAIT